MHKHIFSSIIFIQYRVSYKPWSPINILQRCKIVNFTTLIVASTIIGVRFLQNRTRSSSWNSLLFSNSLHQIPLHDVGWRYVSRQSTESISASPRTFSWYWKSKKAPLIKETFFNGHMMSLILLSHKISIVQFTITLQVANSKSKTRLCATANCFAISAESWMKPFGVNQTCNLRKQKHLYMKNPSCRRCSFVVKL